MKEKLTVIKIGGALLESESTLQDLSNLIKKIAGNKIVVHGGGKKATEISERLGLEIKLFEGRRITDRETLDVATMVYAGLYNKQLVAQFQKNDIKSLGLSGADLNLIKSRKRPVRAIDYGYVGDIVNINTDAIQDLLNLDVVPVFCAITHDNDGQLLNTNADTIATLLSTHLTDYYDVDLFYCMDKPGVMDDPDDETSLISEVNYKLYKTLKMEEKIKLGLIPKMDNAFYALVNDVENVWISNLEGLLSYPDIKGSKICQH
ncbi:acetylglutamate kinase [Membranihabitans maritimus]|uniref:acetylglutamate kinase n=1 Tax=Membranihabitans maritimus TaxID=2904244 RepID=UPI001F025688|nr:acetylglutamate kinase [Membranihabitans maritimus]